MDVRLRRGCAHTSGDGMRRIGGTKTFFE